MAEGDGLEFSDKVDGAQPPVSVPDKVESPAPVVAVLEPPKEPETKPHPLDPGGDRFNQVYARAKKAESLADQLARDMQSERERVARLEGELTTLKSMNPATRQAPKSWAELEQMIALGETTRAAAMDYWTQQVQSKAKADAEAIVRAGISSATREATVGRDLYRYTTAVPDINQAGSEIRQRLDSEFDYAVSVQGRDARTLTQDERRGFEMLALRAVLGPVETVETRYKRQPPETHMETGSQGNARPQPQGNPDQKLLDGLSEREKAHYQKMIAAGKYKGWVDVVKELKWVKPAYPFAKS